MIHTTALVHDKAEIGRDVTIGPFAVIEAGAIIGDGCLLGARTHVKTWTRLGRENRVAEGAILGGAPQHVSYQGEETWLEVGDRNFIGEYVTLHRGTTIRGKTVIGDENYFMGYSHVGHDCLVGSRCVFTSYSALAGHCEMEDRAILGAYAGVHQFTRIGTMAMLGAGAKIGQDLVPYVIAQGYPARPKMVNMVGLQRNDVPEDQRILIRKMFKILFRKGGTVGQAVERLKTLGDAPVVSHMIEFIEKSERGICM